MKTDRYLPAAPAGTRSFAVNGSSPIIKHRGIMKKLIAIIGLGVGLLLVGAAPASASIRLYLELSGVTGPSISRLGAIDITSFGQSVSSLLSGKLDAAACGKLTVQKQLDQTSPVLMEHAMIGTMFQQAVLAMAVSVGAAQSQDQFSITMNNAVVVSVTDDGASGSDLPSESIALQAPSYVVSFLPQNPDGTLGAPVTATVDCISHTVR
jgi:type VI protein secretion system component Hcp